MNQPNILILHLDQLRQDCLGCYGNPDVHTPNIDALAQDSVTYQNHYTVYPICTPSRYSFFSSLYVHQHGAWDNHSTLPNGYPTFPKQLQKSGYHTSAVGKMHMTPTYQNIGFSEMQLAEQNGIGRFEDDYHRFLMEHGKIDRFDLHHQSDLFRQSPTSHLYDMCQCSESDLDLEFYSSEWITQNALSQIDAWDPKQPELLMIGYINPHHPFDPPAPYSTMYNPDTLHLLPGYLDQPIPFDTQANGTPVDYSTITESEMRSIMAAYYGMITEIDDGIGSIIQKLKEKGLYDNTIIVFTSDHGEYLGYHHMILKCNHLYDPLGKNPAADQISPAAVLRQYRSLSFRKHRCCSYHSGCLQSAGSRIHAGAFPPQEKAAELCFFRRTIRDRAIPQYWLYVPFRFLQTARTRQL